MFWFWSRWNSSIPPNFSLLQVRISDHTSTNNYKKTLRGGKRKPVWPEREPEPGVTVSPHRLPDVLEDEQTFQHPQPRTTNGHRRQTSRKSQFPLAWKWWQTMTNNRKHYSNQTQKISTCSFSLWLQQVPVQAGRSQHLLTPITCARGAGCVVVSVGLSMQALCWLFSYSRWDTVLFVLWEWCWLDKGGSRASTPFSNVSFPPPWSPPGVTNAQQNRS